MAETSVKQLPDAEVIDIFAKRVLAKKVLSDYQEIFQENYVEGVASGEKTPLKLFIINKLDENDEPVPVNCLKLCKRAILDGYPQNTIVCTSKSKIAVRFQLILLIEYEDSSFEIITLPNDLSHPDQYNSATTKAFVEETVIDSSGIPVMQHQNNVVPHETLIINGNTPNDYPSFSYTVTIPFSEFDGELSESDLNDPTLQSYILLKNLDYDIDILEVVDVSATDISQTPPAPVTVSTTAVELSVFEDIIDKLGIDQDIIIEGVPE